jgi:5-methyltetrahydrofolate--homocysteine methyltransferase
MEGILTEIYTSVIDGDLASTRKNVQAAIDQGVDPAAILNQGMIAAMSEVGKRFEEGEYFVPEMLVSARAMQGGLSLLQPLLKQADIKSQGKVIIGTVKGDLHDIGKNLVAMMLEGAGFEVVDLGTDVSADRFVEAAQTNQPDLVAMSALLTTTMPQMEATIKALNTAGLRQNVRVMIGGAPVTDAYARQIGADGYAPDASRAVNLAKSLVA